MSLDCIAMGGAARSVSSQRGYIRCLSFAGSDPTSGAGLQADLKTFQALGVNGATVVTAITAQNSRGVKSVWHLTAEQIEAQFECVFEEHSLYCAKVGMLGTTNSVRVVADLVSKTNLPTILDPVIRASSGGSLTSLDLLPKDYLHALRSTIIPECLLITPNIAEAAALCEIDEDQVIRDPRRAMTQLLELGCHAVLLKGGHLPGDICQDFFMSANIELCFPCPRIPTPHTHGSGCTLSAAICAYIVQQMEKRHADRLTPQRAEEIDLADAIKLGKEFITAAIDRAANTYCGKEISPENTTYGSVIQHR